MRTFTVIPQTSTHYKLSFFSTYSLDVLVKGNGLIYVRDAAISMFDGRKVISGRATKTNFFSKQSSIGKAFTGRNTLKRVGRTKIAIEATVLMAVPG